MTSRLHLSTLSIEGFRGIQNLKLPNLGQVTLLAGKNGVGKTTLLDAIRCYASRGEPRVFSKLITDREEFMLREDSDGDVRRFPNFSSLFTDYGPEVFSFGEIPPTFRIKTSERKCNLTVELVNSEDINLKFNQLDSMRKDLLIKVGRTKFRYESSPLGYSRATKAAYSSFRDSNLQLVPPVPCESVGPEFLSNRDAARLWDAIALTEGESIVIDALKLVLGKNLERIAVVSDDAAPPRYSINRRFIARLSSSSTPVPLKRLGDGANRLLMIALALANCNNGILLIDEAENGIHYSVQIEMWRMLFDAAKSGNIQIIATTHSWDCITAFVAAAAETSIEGVMFRLERSEDEGIFAVAYPEDQIAIAAQQRIEVR